MKKLKIVTLCIVYTLFFMVSGCIRPNLDIISEEKETNVNKSKYKLQLWGFFRKYEYKKFYSVLSSQSSPRTQSSTEFWVDFILPLKLRILRFQIINLLLPPEFVEKGLTPRHEDTKEEK